MELPVSTILILLLSLFLAYAFTVLNSLQGVGIFVFQVGFLQIIIIIIVNRLFMMSMIMI